MADQLRFGIVGTGNIAGQFAEGVAGAERSTAIAVGSRRESSAREFADRFGIARAHGSYDALLSDEDVDAVYLSLPNAMHYDWTLKALEAGKHVLCEKPIAANADQGRTMFDAAQQHGKVLVEAFMYRSHPQTAKILEIIASGRIGELRTIRTSFCFSTGKTTAAQNIRFDADLAGGSLMDIGCYCVDFSLLVAGAEPTTVQGVGHLHETGVDDYAAGSLTFANGQLATFQCGMTLQGDNTAMIGGTQGYLTIEMPWKPGPKGAEIVVHGQTPPRQDGGGGARPEPETITVDAPGTLYAMEADAFADAVAGRAQPAVTREQSLAVMRCVDELRRQVGLPF